MIYIQAEMLSNILWHYPVHPSGCAGPLLSAASRGVNYCWHVSLQPSQVRPGPATASASIQPQQLLVILHPALKLTFNLHIHICTTFAHH